MRTRTLLLLASLAVFMGGQPGALALGEKKPRLARLSSLTQDHYAVILINNLLNFYGNNGVGSHNIAQDVSGFEYPRGSSKTAVYMDGLVWGGKHKGALKIGGSNFDQGLQAGKIIKPGTALSLPVADDGQLPVYRVYRVRPDINPATPFAAVYAQLAEEVQLLNRFAAVTANDLFQQYLQDWQEWPAADGAPFDDLNHDGIYEPEVDTPGVPGADQTLWHVSNDLDGIRTQGLAGCDPIGLEMQRTVWAYRTAGALSSTLFIKYVLINKSGAAIDSMYVSQWSDPDLGNPQDDYVGCDTTLSLGYCYNSTSIDNVYGFAPPAVGYDFLQGPMVPAQPSDSALFAGSWRRGYKNLPVSSFNYFVLGDAQHGDPERHTAAGGRQWYNLFQGLTSPAGLPYTNPETGRITTFAMPGDPVSRSGWIDGMMTGPSDRRLLLITGPFHMADRDTQEVVVALLAAQGPEHLASISTLKAVDRIAQQMYDHLFKIAPPDVAARVSWPDLFNADVHITASGGMPKADGMKALLRQPDGSIAAALDLYDDGAHGDGSAGDQVFANTLRLPRQPETLALDIEIRHNSLVHRFMDILEHLSVIGTIEIAGPIIYAGNLNDDLIANPGENLRYGLFVSNNTRFDLEELIIRPINEESGKYWQVPRLPAGGIYTPAYPDNYFSITMPEVNRSDALPLIVSVQDKYLNAWQDTLWFAIHPLARAAYGLPAAHSFGNGIWGFTIEVVERAATKDHVYRITVEKTMGKKVMNLEDLSSGGYLLHQHDLPDELGYNMPIIDGFKILRGENWGREGLRRDSTRWISEFPAWFTGNEFFSDDHAAFQGGITTGCQLSRWLGHFSSIFNYEDSPRIQVYFDAAHPQKAYRLRRSGPNNEYQLQTSIKPPAPGGEPFVNIPFQVWQISSSAPPRQLTVSFRDQSDDALWNPPVGGSGNEFVFIHNRTYDPLGRQFTYPANPQRPGEVVNDQLTIGAEADIIYGLSLAVISGHSLNENRGMLQIVPINSLTPEDIFEYRTQQIPFAPNLNWPADGARDLGNRFNADWQQPPGADSYQLQLSLEDSLFLAPVFDDPALLQPHAPLDTISVGTQPHIICRYGSRYFWRVRARNIYGIGPWSEIRRFTTAAARTGWRYTANTGINGTIAIPVSCNPGLENRTLRTGDAVGVFFLRNDTLKCAGYGYWQEGQNLMVTVWGDNEGTAIKDGLAAGEEMQFRIWDSLLARSILAAAVPSAGTLKFAANGIYTLLSLTGINAAEIPIRLNAGWNMVSAPLDPLNPEMEKLLEKVRPNLVLVKNGAGEVYWPAMGANAINSWNFRDGYQIYMSADNILRIVGRILTPQLTPLYLRQGWNLIAYLRQTPMAPDSALASLGSSVVVLKNGSGEVWWPQLGVNTIGRMQPSQGYQICLKSSATLLYPAEVIEGQTAAAKLLTAVPYQTQGWYGRRIAMTGTNALLAVRSDDLSEGDEIGVWSRGGSLVGCGVATSRLGVAVIWGESIAPAAAGAQDGEPLSLTLWRRSTGQEVPLDISALQDALSGSALPARLLFKANGLWLAEAAAASTPRRFELLQNYPNPFNAETLIRYEVPDDVHVRIELLNILGQVVAVLVDENKKPGRYQYIFHDPRLSSGLYFCRMTAAGYEQIRKIQLLK